MSLATRCPTCGTVFRVVHDQLLVSQGWVRCGRCAGVFNATDDLLDMATGLPVHLALPDAATAPAPAPAPALAPQPDAPAGPGPAPATATAATATTSAPAAAAPAPMADWRWPDDSSDLPDPSLLLRTPSQELGSDEPRSAPPASPAAPAEASPAHARPAAAAPPEPAHPTADSSTSPLPASGLADALADPAHAAAPALAAMAAFPQAAPPVAEPAPEFVRAAERQAAWRRPPMRAGAVAAALLLATLALLQAALLWRDTLAARHPDSAAPLQALCRVTGCQLRPLHRIEQLSVDASGLSRLEGVAADAPPDAPQYRLSLTLRNRADLPLATPAVELSLTDAGGRLVLRRVLRLAELGAAQTVLAPGQELQLQALLATGGQSVDGYTVELFYP